MQSKWELIENSYEPGTWNVECIASSGRILVVRFSGVKPEQHAREYLEWKNADER